jgi:hypothetical protein
MLWSRLVFAMLNDLILQADAILVSLIVGTERLGNTVGFAVAGGCLSRGIGVGPFYPSNRGRCRELSRLVAIVGINLIRVRGDLFARS